MKLSDIPRHPPLRERIARELRMLSETPVQQEYGSRENGPLYAYQPYFVGSDLDVQHRKNGVLHGWQYSYAENRLYKASLFENGHPLRKLEFSYQNPSIVTKDARYKDHELHGRYVERLSCGRPSVITNFRNGQIHGRLKLYVKGKLRESHRVRKGELHGYGFFYDDKGTLVLQRTYKSGTVRGWSYTFDKGKQVGSAQFNKKGALETWTNYKHQGKPGKYLEVFTEHLTNGELKETFARQLIYHETECEAPVEAPNW